MPRIYSQNESHYCDYGVDFINGAAAMPAGADTYYFKKTPGYEIDTTADELTVMDRLPKADLVELAEQMNLTTASEISKRWLVEAINVALKTAEETTYTVTYDKGDSSATGTAPTETTKYIGDLITLKNNTFTLTGKTFNGWSVRDILYQPGDKVAVGGANLTITATWKAKT